MSNPVIEKYKRYLLLEKGLSSNTIEAYMSDLQKLINFAESRQLTFNSIGQNHLEEFVADLHDKKISPRSMSRVISGINPFPLSSA